jgi:2-hydroxychromene-2-carboxylate isomerase
VAIDADELVFFYDLGSPECYLAAERSTHVLPAVPEWEPVLSAAVDDAVRADSDREAIAVRAAELGLQPLRWPPAWPPDVGRAMLAATYAKHIGRAVTFSLAAFRQEFAAGRDLGDEDTVLIAAAACEMHPTAVLKGITLRSVIDGLQRAGDRARAAGVRSLPALQAGGRVFQGARCVEDAALALGAAA